MTVEEYIENAGLDRGDGEPICIAPKAAINCEDMAGYIRAYPEKAAAWLADRIIDDDMASLRADLYEYICVADWNGPAFEEWRKT